MNVLCSWGKILWFWWLTSITLVAKDLVSNCAQRTNPHRLSSDAQCRVHIWADAKGGDRKGAQHKSLQVTICYGSHIWSVSQRVNTSENLYLWCWLDKLVDPLHLHRPRTATLVWYWCAQDESLIGCNPFTHIFLVIESMMLSSQSMELTPEMWTMGKQWMPWNCASHLSGGICVMSYYVDIAFVLCSVCLIVYIFM